LKAGGMTLETCGSKTRQKNLLVRVAAEDCFGLGVELASREDFVAAGIASSLQAILVNVWSEGHDRDRRLRQRTQLSDQLCQIGTRRAQVDYDQLLLRGRGASDQIVDVGNDRQRGAGAKRGAAELG
jgi:hypothetical protein